MNKIKFRERVEILNKKFCLCKFNLDVLVLRIKAKFLKF